MNPTRRLLALPVCVCVGGMLAYAAALGPPSARGKTPVLRAELSATAKAVVERGFHAELPPHISTLLGLTREEKSAVMQGVLRSVGKVEGIDVAEKNHNDVVIFIVDETTGKQMLYLTSPSGELRRVLVVEKGVGRVVKPSEEDAEVFRAEKKMWVERMGMGMQRRVDSAVSVLY